jgi:hypothetical protein
MSLAVKHVRVNLPLLSPLFDLALELIHPPGE